MTEKIIEILIFVEFVKKNFDKFTDHCHLTGKNRGPARNNCNYIVT